MALSVSVSRWPAQTQIELRFVASICPERTWLMRFCRIVTWTVPNWKEPICRVRFSGESQKVKVGGRRLREGVGAGVLGRNGSGTKGFERHVRRRWWHTGWGTAEDAVGDVILELATPRLRNRFISLDERGRLLLANRHNLAPRRTGTTLGTTHKRIAVDLKRHPQVSSTRGESDTEGFQRVVSRPEWRAALRPRQMASSMPTSRETRWTSWRSSLVGVRQTSSVY